MQPIAWRPALAFFALYRDGEVVADLDEPDEADGRLREDEQSPWAALIEAVEPRLTAEASCGRHLVRSGPAVDLGVLRGAILRPVLAHDVHVGVGRHLA